MDAEDKGHILIHPYFNKDKPFYYLLQGHANATLFLAICVHMQTTSAFQLQCVVHVNSFEVYVFWRSIWG